MKATAIAYLRGEGGAGHGVVALLVLFGFVSDFKKLYRLLL